MRGRRRHGGGVVREVRVGRGGGWARRGRRGQAGDGGGRAGGRLACAKKSDSRPKIFDESVVLATEKATSRPILSVLTASWSLMNLIDSFIAIR